MVEYKKIGDKKKKAKEPIKPVLVVPGIDREQHSVFIATTQEEAELLRTAFQNPHGVDVRGPPKGKKKTCPCEPETPYEESICKEYEDVFKKHKKKRKEKREEK